MIRESQNEDTVKDVKQTDMKHRVNDIDFDLDEDMPIPFDLDKPIKSQMKGQETEPMSLMDKFTLKINNEFANIEKKELKKRKR